MERWRYYEGKKVFIILRNGRKYQGQIIDVDDTALPIVFITMIDKFDKRVSFVQSEITSIQEERE